MKNALAIPAYEQVYTVRFYVYKTRLTYFMRG